MQVNWPLNQVWFKFKDWNQIFHVHHQTRMPLCAHQHTGILWAMCWIIPPLTFEILSKKATLCNLASLESIFFVHWKARIWNLLCTNLPCVSNCKLKTYTANNSMHKMVISFCASLTCLCTWYFQFTWRYSMKRCAKTLSMGVGYFYHLTSYCY